LVSYARHYFDNLAAAARAVDCDALELGADLVEDAWRCDRQIFTFGNGGSASTASHWACDWGKGISYGKRDQRTRVVCLCDNLPTILAYANDVGYKSVFVEQLKSLMQRGDLVVGVSGSGNSRNVLEAIVWANANGGVTLGVCGFDGGELKELSQYAVHINVPDMQLVEDLHLSFGHFVMRRLTGQSTCPAGSG
jgi:D-sedoheptulose 7-phosphate isomerase